MDIPEFPNDWPPHFNESMVFPPITSIAPVGSNKMWFKDMDYQQFEQFCWFLLQKDYRLEGCQHIGGSGTKQAGIDLFARDKFNTSQLIMFECKCWEEFDKTNLKNAVDKFVDSPWIKYKPKFILIIAQEELGKLSETWLEQSARLDKLEIQSDVWTGKHLASRVQHFPDIVTRFFTALTTQLVCHDWMRNVRFIERLHYAYSNRNSEIREIAEELLRDASTGDIIDIEKTKLERGGNIKEWSQGSEFKQRLDILLDHENPDVRALAKEFINLSSKNNEPIDQKTFQLEAESGNEEIEINNKKFEQIFEDKISWTIDHPSIYIQCFKPGSRFYPASALINIRQENASGVDVTLTQKWLLKNMFGAEGAPVDHMYRPFIINEFNLKSTQRSTIRLQNCQLYPPRDKMEEICNAIDKFSQVVTKELLKLESDWDAVDFPFVHQGSSTYVAICEMPKWLWKLILEFCSEHDIGKGETDWHIFDQSHWYLKIFTNMSHSEFDPGYHGIFQVKEDLEDTTLGKSVTVLWQPPDSFIQYAVDKRKWMPCCFALSWITDRLLPKVKEWARENEVSRVNIFKRAKARKEFDYLWDRDIQIRDLREFPLLRNQRYQALGLVETIEQLQCRIDTHGRAIYLTAEDVKNLYEALILILNFKRGYASYIASNLSIRDSGDTHEEISTALRKRLTEGKLNLNMYALQHMLSAFLESLRNNDNFLSEDQKTIVFQAMFPIMADFDKRQFYQRHMKWIE